MPSDKDPIKQVIVRWSESFWESIAIEATFRRSSIQSIVTESVRLFMDMSESKRERILRDAETAAEAERQSAA